MARLSREFVKLETRILNDHRFFTLSEFDQLLYIKLLGLSRTTQNRIPKKPVVIQALIRTNRNETEIKSALKRIKFNFPKFKENKYFYYFDGYELRMNNSKRDEDEDEDEDKDEERKKKIPLSDFDFLQTLKTNPAYKHIDIDTELAKMDVWLLTHQGRQKTRRFIVNWLNKIDKPVNTQKPEPKSVKPEPINEIEHAKVSALIHETVEKLKRRKYE